MSQVQASASHWVLLLLLVLLNKYMLVWSIDYASVGRSSVARDHRSWSEWSSWSACSRTCGGGVKMKSRVCNMRSMFNRSVVPNACVGESIEYELCSVHNCSPFDKEFLEYQCSLKDGQSVGGRRIGEWTPYRYGTNPCELQCWSEDRTVVHSFGKTIDGTKCAPADRRQSAVCINGRCTPVDCAGQIGKDNRLDRCGVCRGDNSTCEKHQAVFWRRPRAKRPPDNSKDHYEYEKITRIPAGASAILVKEYGENNFLAIMDHKDHYQLNGNWRVQSPGRILVHGSEFVYSRTWDGGESLSAIGPIRFDVSIYALGSGDLPTVRYEYWISTTNPFKPERTLPTLNQVKLLEDLEQTHLQPENNHIHDASAFTKKPTVPQPKSLGYKSYYHRNEILKSVPSWSIKRHPHRSNRYSPFPSENDTPKLQGTDYVTESHRYRPSNGRRIDTSYSVIAHANPKPDLHSNLTVQRPVTGKTDPTSIPRTTPISRTDNFQGVPGPSARQKPHSSIPWQDPTQTRSSLRNSTINQDRDVLSTRRKKHNSKSRNNKARRRRVYEQKVDQYGRPTTTLAQNRNVTHHRTYLALQPTNINGESPASNHKKVDSRKHFSQESCHPCPKPKHQKRSFCASDFVLRVTVLSSEKQEENIRYEMDIVQSFKNKVPISPREYIWTTDPCRCPKLRIGKEYIIMGFSGTSGNRRESRLLINRTSFTRKYTEKRMLGMRRLARDHKTICKKFD